MENRKERISEICVDVIPLDSHVSLCAVINFTLLRHNGINVYRLN